MRTTVIAEIGVNHGGSMGLAKTLIKKAQKAGADIAKFQLFNVDKRFPDKMVIAQGRNWYSEVQKAQLNKEQVFELAKYCKEIGIEFFASAADTEGLSWLEEIGVKRHKIASPHIRNTELISAIAKTGKDIIVSLGLWENGRVLKEYSEFPGIKTTGKVDFLYCVSKYPASLEDIKSLNQVDFTKYSGFSSHHPGIEPAVFAMARGARIVEVHFCLSRKIVTGPDITSSVEPKELLRLIKFARVVEFRFNEEKIDDTSTSKKSNNR